MPATSASEPGLPAGNWTRVQAELLAAPRPWLVTGAAGFIGSHLLETLLKLGQPVVALDNFSTGHRRNLEQVLAAVGARARASCVLHQADVRDPVACAAALHHPAGAVRHVLHQAALGSVPRSLREPYASHDSNVNGFLQVLVAARDAGVESLVYASSSSVYGDHPGLPKLEEATGAPLSPYAASKVADELYAGVFARCYGLNCSGLRYFNVFGARQDPEGAYAAVIPAWTAALLRRQAVWINGDGETSRDFCYVANVVQANLLAALRPAAHGAHRVYNVAVGERVTLNQLFGLLRDGLAAQGVDPATRASHREFRAGDVRHSLADITRARRELGYQPGHRLAEGLALALPWYVANCAQADGAG